MPGQFNSVCTNKKIKKSYFARPIQQRLHERTKSLNWLPHRHIWKALYPVSISDFPCLELCCWSSVRDRNCDCAVSNRVRFWMEAIRKQATKLREQVARQQQVSPSLKPYSIFSANFFLTGSSTFPPDWSIQLDPFQCKKYDISLILSLIFFQIRIFDPFSAECGNIAIVSSI